MLRRRTYRLCAIGTCVVVVALLMIPTAYGSGSSQSSSVAKVTKKQVNVVSLLQPLQNPWVVNNVRFQKAVAKALGINLSIVTDQNSPDSNVAAMRSIIAKHPDGILFDPISQAAGLADARLIEADKIPAVAEDRLVKPNISQYHGKYLIAQVTQQNKTWGYATMNSLISQGVKKIVTIMPPHGIPTIEELWQGAQQALAQHPDVKVLQQTWATQDREHAFATMQQYLVKYGPGSIDGLFAIGSTGAFGAIQAIKAAHRQGQIKIATADDDPDVIHAIETGELKTTFGTHWSDGAFGLVVLYDYLQGHKPLSRQPEFRLFKIDKSIAAAYATRFLQQVPFRPCEIRKLSLTYNPQAKLPWVMNNWYRTWNTPSRGLPPGQRC